MCEGGEEGGREAGKCVRVGMREGGRVTRVKGGWRKAMRQKDGGNEERWVGRPVEGCRRWRKREGGNQSRECEKGSVAK